LIGLTKNTSAYYASKGIRCNVIAAGAMATNMTASLGAGGINMEGVGLLTKYCMSMPRTCLFASLLTYVPKLDPDMKGEVFCDVKKMADIALFLCSDTAEVVNGAVWEADGGVSAH
jgi:NAD(P)-dependent dehydrogenase (short-subunit alcohol dehydrogenase family)